MDNGLAERKHLDKATYLIYFARLIPNKINCVKCLPAAGYPVLVRHEMYF